MATSIQLPPRLAEKLRASAAQNGLDINQYVIQLLEEKVISISEPATREQQLLTDITTGLPVDTWKRYNYLKHLRDEEQLDPEEHAELLRISDQIEAADVRRLKHLIELADLRKISVPALMSELGIQPSVNG